MRVDCHEKVLGYLAEQWSSDGICFSDFGMICAGTDPDRKQVRRSRRYLARKGLAVFGRGLWTEDGEPRGSGYAATPGGVATVEAVKLTTQIWGESGENDTGNKKILMSQRLR
jgi:hypothetical protein